MLASFLKEEEWKSKDVMDGRLVVQYMKLDVGNVKVNHVRAFDPGTKNVGDGLFLVGDIRNPYNLGIYIGNRHNVYHGDRTTFKLPNGKLLDIAPWTRTEVKALELVRSLKRTLAEADVCLVERQMTKPDSETEDVINVGAQLLAAGALLCPYAIRNDPAQVANHFSYLFPSELTFRDRRGHVGTKKAKEKPTYDEARTWNKLCAVVAARDEGMLTKQEWNVITQRLVLIELEATQAFQSRLASFRQYAEERGASPEDIDSLCFSLKEYEIKKEEDDCVDPMLDVAELLRELFDVDILQRRLSVAQKKIRIRYLVFLREAGEPDQDWRLVESSNELRCVIVLPESAQVTRLFFESNFECEMYITNTFNPPSYAIYCSGKRIDWIDDFSGKSQTRDEFMSYLHSQFPTFKQTAMMANVQKIIRKNK